MIGIIDFKRQDLAKILEEKIKARGASSVIINLNEICGEIYQDFKWELNGLNLKNLEAALVLDITQLGEVSYKFESRLNFLEFLEEVGVFMVNSARVIRDCMDKQRSSIILAKNGIPTPRTIVTESLERALESVKSVKEIVVKPPYGSCGRGMIKTSANDKRTLEEMLKRYGLLYLQEYIPNPGRDIRVLCLGGKIVLSIYRIAKEGEWRSNVCQGGRVERCELTEEVEKVVLKTAKAFGSGFAAIDVLESEGGPLVLEVNCFPRWLYLLESIGYDFGDDLVNFVIKRSL